MFCIFIDYDILCLIINLVVHLERSPQLLITS